MATIDAVVQRVEIPDGLYTKTGDFRRVTAHLLVTEDTGHSFGELSFNTKRDDELWGLNIGDRFTITVRKGDDE